MGKVDCHTSDYFNNNERLVEVLTNVKIQRVKEAERANTRNKALQSDIRKMKKEMKALVKKIKELEGKNVLVE